MPPITGSSSDLEPPAPSPETVSRQPIGRPLPLGKVGDGIRGVWARVDEGVEELDHLTGFLSPDERRRLDRITAPARALGFVLGRALARRLLGETLGLAPHDVPIAIAPEGKPFVDLPAAPGFSISHCRTGVAVGVSDRAGIGLDVEAPRAAPKGVIDRTFSPAERDWLQGLGPQGIEAGFARLWTIKEAIAKATGAGLGAPLPEIAVPPTRSGRVGAIEWVSIEVSGLGVCSVARAPG